MPDSQIPQKPGSITPPVPPAPAAKEPVIRTMPEKYIGAAAGRPPVVREIVEKRVIEAPPLRQGSAGQAPIKRTKRTIIIASIVVLLAGAGAVAYILLTPTGQAPPPPPVNTNIPVANININVPPPTAPVCGNGALETGEECDDGNTVAGDDCSDICKIEPKTVPPPNTGVDSDSDGLTDIEETTVYGTDPHQLDTDHDSFNDGNEVAHLYDPNIKAPARLNDSKVMAAPVNKAEGYSVLAPAKWALSGQETAQFIIGAPSGEFFEVLETEKAEGRSLVEWYLSMSPGAKAEEIERFKTLEGYDALRSPDRLTAYVDTGDGRLFTLTYSFDEQTKLEFRTTYEAFLASFALLKE